MRRLFVLAVTGLAAIVMAAVILVPHWSLPVAGRQLGWRASSMVQFAPTREDGEASPTAFQALPPGSQDRRPATTAFKNIKVLTNADAGEVMRVMTAMTTWVAPKQGCGFCHAGTDYASEANPRFGAARLMLQMTRHLNTVWKSHLGGVGVTCAMCHQGQAVPEDVWYAARAQPPRPMIDRAEDWHEDEKTVRKFFPDEGYEEYLLQNTPGVAQSYTALPTHNGQSLVVVKRLYEYMMQTSDGIGVNCGYCHNSRAFWDWSQSTPARWTGYSGIQMTRDLNRNYLLKIGAAIPQTRLPFFKTGELNIPPRDQGAVAGNGLADCATCHHGQPTLPREKGLAQAYPELLGSSDSAAPSPTPSALAVAAKPAQPGG